MKKQTIWSLLALAGAAVVAGLAMPNHSVTAEQKPERLLRHVVLFRFKADCTPEQIKQVTDAFAALPHQITTIQSFEWGTDVSVENKADGFTHCFLVTFRTAKDRDDYLPHPVHKEFGKLVGPRLDKVLVVDYWAN